MTNAETIKHLRKVAKANGWTVSKWTAAPSKRRVAVELYCIRMERPPWDPTGTTLTSKASYARIEVKLDAFDDSLYAFRSSTRLSVEDIEAILVRPRACQDEAVWARYEEAVAAEEALVYN